MATKIPITAVVAVTPSYGIGQGGELPWGHALPGDLAHFRKMTKSTIDPSKQNACLMGRKTWLGIPEKNRPLKGRINIVLTRDQQWAKENLPSDVYVASSLENAMALIGTEPLQQLIESVVIVGGVQLFEESILHPWCDTYHVTKLDTEYECDTILTPTTIQKLESLQPIRTSEDHEENGIKYRMFVYSPNGVKTEYP